MLYAPRLFYTTIASLLSFSMLGFAPAVWRYFIDSLWYLNPLMAAASSSSEEGQSASSWLFYSPESGSTTPRDPDFHLDTHVICSFVFLSLYASQFLLTGPTLITYWRGKYISPTKSSGGSLLLSYSTSKTVHKYIGIFATLPLIAVYAVHSLYMVVHGRLTADGVHLNFSDLETSSAALEDTTTAHSKGLANAHDFILALGGNIPKLQMWQYWWAFGSTASALSVLINSTRAVLVFWNNNHQQKSQAGKSVLSPQEKQRKHVDLMIAALFSFMVPGILRATGLAIQLLYLDYQHQAGSGRCDYLNISGYVTVMSLGILTPAEILVRYSIWAGGAPGGTFRIDLTRILASVIDIYVGVQSSTLFRC